MTEPIRVTLPGPKADIVKRRMAETGHSSPEEYITALIDSDTDAVISEELEAKLLANLGSGPPMPIDVAFWEAMRSDLERRMTQKPT